MKHIWAFLSWLKPVKPWEWFYAGTIAGAAFNWWAVFGTWAAVGLIALVKVIGWSFKNFSR